MSSALQAQLAALNGTAGKHPGSTYAPNKRHEEAVGRGIDYNVQQGQIVYNRDIRFRATLIYKNPKEAADVPLSTLQENCQDALTSLSEDLMPSLSSAGVILCGQEDASNAYIQQTLIRITILLGEKDEKVTENCLHVLEYLLRRYEIHRHHLMESFLWTFLPHHQQLPNLWHRCLLLLDLASHPSYLWLRPYADANRPTPTPRALCARKIVQEIPLLRRLCQVVQKTAAEHAMETAGDDDGDSNTPLRGWSHIFSWTAACLVDGLIWQQDAASQQAVDRVALARILVPAVRQALRKTDKEDYCNWGCVVASTMAECLELSSSVVTLWGTALLDHVAIADPTTAWSALASILLVGQSPNYVDEESYMCLVRPNDNQWVGCPLPAKLFAVMTPDCAEHLGNLYQNQRLEVTPLVVAIFVRAMRDNQLDLSTALLEEDSLNELWKKHNLVASVAAWIALNTSSESSLINFSTGRAILQSLCNIYSSTPVEKGIAQASTEVAASELKPLLEGIVSMVVSAAEATSEEKTDMLPPRVALEHPDVEVRRRALEQLVKKKDSYSSAGDMANQGESLMETVVRRLSVEPNLSLAKEYARALIGSDVSLITADRPVDQFNGVLSAAYHWVGLEDEEMADLLSKIVEKVLNDASNFQVSEVSGPTFQLLSELSTSLISPGDAPRSLQVLERLSDSLFLQGVVDNYDTSNGKTSNIEHRVRHRCTWAILAALGDPTNSNGEILLVEKYLQLFLRVVRFHGGPFDSSQQDVLRGTLQRMSTLLSGSPSQVVSALIHFATLDVKDMADFISSTIRSIASTLTDAVGDEVSPLAVLMEAATRPDASVKSVQKLLAISKEMVLEGTGPIWILIVPLLALLSNSEKGVREASVSIMSTITTKYGSEKKDTASDMSTILSLCEVASNESISLSQIGTKLETFFARCMQQTNSESTKSLLINLATHALFTSSKRVQERSAESFEASSWIHDHSESGTREAGCTVLEAMEVAGEEAFSLSLRWNNMGCFVFKWLIQQGAKAPTRITSLVARLLKGVVVSEPQIVIMSGPRTGGARSRSYSVGNLDGVEIIRPYPTEMVQSILEAIRSSSNMQDEVVQTVLASNSWSGYVFPILDSTDRKSIVKSLLKSGSKNEKESLVRVGISLPLDSSEAADLVEDAVVAEDEFTYMAVLLDYLRSNAGRLAGRKGSGCVLSNLFTKVREISNFGGLADEDAVEYLLLSSLRIISDLLSENLSDISSYQLSEWVNLTLAILGAPRDKRIMVKHNLKTFGGRSLCLKILSAIASFNSGAVVEAVADLALNLTSKPDSFSVEEVRAGLSVSVPLFWSNILSSSRTLTSFLHELIEMIVARPVGVRDQLLVDLVKTMCGAAGVDEQYRNVSPGVVSLIVIAAGRKSMTKAELKEVVLMVFESSPSHSQIASLPFLVSICRQIMGQVLGTPSLEDSGCHVPTSSEIIEVVKSAQDDAAAGVEFDFLSDLIGTVSDCVILENVQRLLRKRSTLIATSSLQLWQNLLLIHSTAEAALSSKNETDLMDANSWRSIAVTSDDCRELVQANLPASIFLAAVRSLLRERAGADLRSRALRLAADRVLELDLHSNDKALFVDFLSDATEMLRNKAEDARERQGALIYIEHATRSLFLPSSNEKAEKVAFQQLSPVFAVCCDLINDMLAAADDLTQLDMKDWHLLASALLACATLIRVVGVRALSKLSGLLRPLPALISHANQKKHMNMSDDKDGSFQALIQIALLRFTLSAIETVPQSVFAHLPGLLSESSIFSESLRKSDDSGVSAVLGAVDNALTVHIPARLLIPALAKLLSSKLRPDTMRYVLLTLAKTIARLESTEGGIYRSHVLQAALKAYEDDSGERMLLFEAANKCLLELILKLSELQFRKMYGELSEWMKEEPSKRKLAFWSVSEAFSKELATIFLPCASMVFEEMAKDLNTFAETLSVHHGGVEIVNQGRKKRKKTVAHEGSLDHESLSSLIPLLSTVSTILRADAQDGGKWTREHGRYHALVEPLTKLLLSRVPETFPCTSGDVTRYEYLVEDNPRATVVGCLTSLALAAGDEQLWKPMNHAVLEACAIADRSEVRKAGVRCLLSLLRTLGEEYMVLLPECLPVLAELLEDENEIVAGLARDCVMTAEELLGESLEQNLM